MFGNRFHRLDEVEIFAGQDARHSLFGLFFGSAVAREVVAVNLVVRQFFAGALLEYIFEALNKDAALELARKLEPEVALALHVDN